MDTPSFLEDHSSQVPALQLLQKLGFTYLPPKEVHLERRGKLSNVLLEEVLRRQLARLNRIRFKGNEHAFSEENLTAAIQALKNPPQDLGLVGQNEWLYDLLSLGKSLEQTIDGDTKSFSLRYIDWEQPENNVFHVTEEFEVSRATGPAATGRKNTRRPDIVLFVNGIPLVVIECKRPDIKGPIDEAVSQQLRNQNVEETPHLFRYSQLLLALAVNDARYGTTATSREFWSRWREREDQDTTLQSLVNRPLTAAQKDALLAERFQYVREYFEDLELAGERAATSQDRLLHALCRPERLLDLIHGFIVYDAGEKKIARYQQYFAIKAALERVRQRELQSGRRIGGVVWHTQGSGKSLTMVMLAKALALEPDIRNPKVVLVTDRVDLDDQLWKNFHHCGKEPVRAKTGKHLLELLRADKAAIVTTVINKFQAALKKEDYRDEGDNIFVLVDEAHRTQHGKVAGFGNLNVAMQKILPKACYLGFTGTPLRKMEKRNTERLLGGFIGEPYTMSDAVADEAVVPLLYEGRHALQEVNRSAVDKWFEVASDELNDKQKADLKRKFSSADQLNRVKGTIREIAWDISEHFSKSVEAPFKAQLTAPTKAAALMYKECLDEFGKVTSEVLISGPDTREGNEDVYRVGEDVVQAFWKRTMERFNNSEKEYNRSIINKFLYDDDPDIIIVVDKLLTGFDAPRNRVLYITRSLKEHTLLQAIARVNRLHPGKDFGVIVDYYGVIEQLGEALDIYATFREFEEGDLAGTICDISSEVEKLPQHHSELWDLFKHLPNRKDIEAYERHLGDEETRTAFYDRLARFSRTLSIALSSMRFAVETPASKLEEYTADLAFFQSLRASVKRRYSEGIDYREYEARVQKLLDEHVTSHEVEPITKQVNIFETERFRAEVEKLTSTASKADTIASRTKRTITERMDEDPAFYRKFSRILEEAIAAFRAQRITDAEYFKRVDAAREAVVNRGQDDAPEPVRNNRAARAFYHSLREVIGNEDGPHQKLAVAAALEIEATLSDLVVVDWKTDPDVEKSMRNAIDDVLFVQGQQNGIELNFDDLDRIAELCLTVARAQYEG